MGYYILIKGLKWYFRLKNKDNDYKKVRNWVVQEVIRLAQPDLFMDNRNFERLNRICNQLNISLDYKF